MGKAKSELGSTGREKKQKDGLNRANGGSTSEIMDRNYPGPNPLAFDGFRHSR